MLCLNHHDFKCILFQTHLKIKLWPQNELKVQQFDFEIKPRVLIAMNSHASVLYIIFIEFLLQNSIEGETLSINWFQKIYEL